MNDNRYIWDWYIKQETKKWGGQLPNWLQQLNKPQQAAVLQQNSHLLVTAGPGTGKTQTMASRALYLLLTGTKPMEMVILTFSRAGKLAIERRLNQLASYTGYNGAIPDVRTFHSFCLKLLRKIAIRGHWLQPGFQIIEDKVYAKEDGFFLTVPALFLERYEELLGGLDDGLNQDERLEYYPVIIHRLRAGHPTLGLSLRPETLADEGDLTLEGNLGQKVVIPGSKVKLVYRNYLLAMKEENAIDFTGMVAEVLLALREKPEIIRPWVRFSHLLVDEYQDTSKAQEGIIREIAKLGTFLSVVGDDDQTIYTFNGSDVTNMLEFTQRNNRLPIRLTQTINLTSNYRSNQRIVEVSQKLIRNNQQRLAKTIQAVPKNYSAKEAVFLFKTEDLYTAADLIAQEIEKLTRNNYQYSDIAVLFRKNSLAYPEGDAVFTSLRKKGLPAFLEKPRRITETLKKVQELAARYPEMSITQAISQTTSVTGTEKLRRILESYQDEGLTTLSEVARSLAVLSSGAISKTDQQGVRILSIHQSKGREFPVVFILFLAEKEFPDFRALGNDLEEERRLLYVALTRAKEKVYLYGKPSTSFNDFYQEIVTCGIAPDKT